jgi:DNA-directed RNA polymerase subunit RPC12/RpoP
MNTIVATEGSTTMPGSTEYECGECRHRFRIAEGAAHDARLLMCPACGSIDLNLIAAAARTPDAVWRVREDSPAERRDRRHDKLAS